MNTNKEASITEARTKLDNAATPKFEATILRLVRGKKERRAIELGEVDAILDPITGRAILLPQAQSALLAQESFLNSLVKLASDGYWEQDENYRVTVYSGTGMGIETGPLTPGRALWELPFENHSASDWQTHRTQLEWRAVFRDLELSYEGSDGQPRHISISGEPRFDADGQFTGYRGITRDITPRKIAQWNLAQNRQFERAALNALAVPVCVLDVNGIIETTNATWWTLVELGGPGLAEGGHYLSACAHDERLTPSQRGMVAAGLAQVAGGERELFCFEQDFDSATGPRWFMVSASKLRHDGATRTMLAYDDISAGKRAAQWLALESSVAACLASGSDKAATLSTVLQACCEAQQWDCGQFFEFDPSSLTLGPTAQWGRANVDVENFLAKSPRARFRADAGLAGRVQQANQPLWIRDPLRDPRMATALPHEIGMRGNFMFPVRVDDVSYGVLAFASDSTVREPDERALQTVLKIGTLLGHFLRRDAAEAQQRHSEQRYRRFTALGCDWHWETDRELRFIATTDAGVAGVSDILGKRLWDLPHLRVSDEEWARLKAEIAAQWSFCDFACMAVLPDGRETRYCISGEPVFDDEGVFSGFLGIGLDVTGRNI